MIGQTISHYKILEKLGEGGMGVVYKAHDTTLDRTVALKFLPHYLTSDATEKERFYHEARAASALNHPNITTIHEIAEYDGQLYMAMEFVKGKTLKKVIVEDNPSIKKVLDIGIQACDGLSIAHERGVVHRDIKSENIMLTAKGQVKIMDFGLAKVKGATKLTKAGSTLGTLAYMSPEQAQGEEVDHRSDIFSFGVVLYELLTGKLPFRGEHHAALVYSLLNEDPPPIARFNDKVTTDLERIVMKALAKDKDERYQHVDDMLADLRRERKNLEYARTGYVKTTTIAQPVEVVKPRRNILKYVIPAGMIVVLVILVLMFNPFNLQLSTQKTTASEKNSLAVLYFQNIAEPEDKDHIGDMLIDLLITSLSQSKDFEVISRERLYDIQKELKVESKVIAPDMASKVAQRAGVTTMLLGSILQKEPELAVTTRLIDVKSGRIINSQRVTGFSTKQIFSLVDTLALLVRNDLIPLGGTSAPSEAKSVAEVTTSSPEAYRSYIEGVDLNNKFYTAEVKAAFNRAIELDSNFAMAYFALSVVALDPSDALTRIKALEKAYELRKKVTEKERLLIEARYLNNVESNPSKSAEVLEKLLEKYPHEQTAYVDLQFAYGRLFEHEKAQQVILNLLKIDPLDKIAWNSLAYSYAGFNRKKEAIEAIDHYLKLAPGEANPYDSKGELYAVFGDIDSALYWFQKAITFRTDFGSSATLGGISLLRQDYGGAEKYFQQFGSTSDKFQKADAENALSLIPVHRGQLQQAQQQILRNLSNFQAQKLRQAVLNNYLWLHLIAYERGDYPSMLEYAQQRSLELKKDPNDNIYGRHFLALAYLKNGNPQMSSKIMDELKKNLQTNLPQQQVAYDYTLALLAYEQWKYDIAVTQFQKALRPLLPNHAPQFFFAVNLLKTGHVSEAIEELQRVTRWCPISYPPISLFLFPTAGYWPIASVKAHYWLGVAYEQQGQKDQAIKEYEKFLDIWKDADFKSKEMDDAKARLAKLKGKA